jgi:hypothetical protein
LKKIILSLCGITLLALSAFAQAEEEDDVYDSEFSYGVNLNTNAGLIGGIMFKYTRKASSTMYHYFYLEVVDVKHPREKRISNQTVSLTPYKQNYLFAVRPSYGRELVLFRKAPEQGVQINAILAAGPSFGLIKPYYVLWNRNPANIQSVPYNPSMQPGEVLSSGSFFDGFDQMQIKLGAHIKAAMSFELGTFRNNVTGFEVGLLAEAFTQKIAIMDPTQTSPQSVFTSAYINIFFGSRK